MSLDYIDQEVDYSTDPLVILLMREGEYDEAYQMARQQTATARQIVLQHEIETCERVVRRVKRSTHH